MRCRWIDRLNVELFSAVVVVENQQSITVRWVRQPVVNSSQNFITLEFANGSRSKDSSGHRVQTVIQCGLRRHVEPKHRRVDISVSLVLRLGECDLCFPDTSNSTEDNTLLLLLQAVDSEMVTNQLKLSLPPDERYRVEIHSPQANTRSFAKAEV